MTAARKTHKPHRRFRRHDRVRVLCDFAFEATIIRYVEEMTFYRSGEHDAGWWETTGGTVHENQLELVRARYPSK